LKLWKLRNSRFCLPYRMAGYQVDELSPQRPPALPEMGS
jgi:hypothetical protein